MRTRTTSGLLAILAFAVVLRILRVFNRWDEVTLAYAAYPEPTARALEEGRWLDAVTSWVGLHPPLHGLLHAFTEVLLPIPLLWLSMSAAATVGVILLVAHATRSRQGWATASLVAAALLAVAPTQLADTAEVNNYPLAALSIAAVLATARAPWPWLAAAGALAAWSHLLAGWIAGAVLALRAGRDLATGRRADAARLLAAGGLAVLPVAAGVVVRMGKSGTFDQPDLNLGTWFGLVHQTLGPLGALLTIPVIVGLLL
ncbi:MAG: hypothetical protein QGG40_15795, partial [Myxococcota bacterium]|nr:hypothetical protein [Myxococcota bacterium]